MRQRTRVVVGWIGSFLAAQLVVAGFAWGAGNVTASVVGDDLVIVGDNRDNRFIVGRTGNPDEFVVTGQESTTINGLPEVVLTATGDVRIATGRGDDRPRIDGQIPGSVFIDTGRGDDVVAIGDPVIGGDLWIETGRGRDLVDIQDTLLEQDLMVSTGRDGDRIYFFSLIVRGDTLIHPGVWPPWDQDVIEIETTDFGGTLTIED